MNQGTEAAERQPKAWSTWSTRAQESAAQRTKEAAEAEPSDPSEIVAANPDADDDQEDFADASTGAVGDPNTDPFCSFWKGADLRVCTEICTVLDEADIPHKTIRRQDHLFNLINQSPYEIGVPASLYQRAENAIREAFGTEDESEETLLLGDGSRESMKELDEMPLREKLKQRPEEEIPTFFESMFRKKKDGGGEALEESAKETRKSPNGEWYLEDATSLIWEGDPERWRPAIEMSLQELDIPMRWETGNGTERVYVLPEDESRAKEIVQEVVTGEPSDGED